MARSILGIAVCCLVVCQTQTADAAACSANDAALEARMKEIQASYDKKFQSRRSNVERESEDIKKDSPNPSAVGGAIGFDIDVKWKTQEVKLHVPEIRSEDKRVSFNVPRMETRQQTWIYHTPSVRMEMKCVPKPPELVCGTKQVCIGGGWSRICSDVPDCRMRAAGEMCTHIPVPFMQEQKTILGVPEIVGSDRHEIVLTVPVLEMKLQTWKLDLPEITIKNIKVEANKAQERAAALQQREQNASKALSDSMQGDMKKASAENMEDRFQCEERSIRETFAKAKSEIENNIGALRDAIKVVQGYAAKDLESSMQKSLDQMEAARQQILANYQETIAKLAEQKKQAIEKLFSPT